MTMPRVCPDQRRRRVDPGLPVHRAWRSSHDCRLVRSHSIDGHHGCSDAVGATRLTATTVEANLSEQSVSVSL